MEIDDIINDYTYNYLGTNELARKYGLHRMTIQRRLKKANIKLRKKTPQYRVNHHFFSQYNENSCYWAGFILADGYIRNKNRFTLEIKLQKGDVEHLYKFKRNVEYEGKIIERDTYYSITISSEQIINDLFTMFNIYNNKSLTCFISDKIPIKYLKDFIRGYFDGDGCITHTTTDTINFLGTNKTINFIREYFFTIVGIKLRSKEMPNITTNGNICVINYSGKSAFKCLHYMYNNSTTYLDRKFFKYGNLIKKYS